MKNDAKEAQDINEIDFGKLLEYHHCGKAIKVMDHKESIDSYIT